MYKVSLSFLKHLFMWAPALIFMSCSSSNEPEPLDCANSDLALTFSKTDLTSCTANNGSISANASGGAAPYQFALDSQPFGSNSTFSGLSTGVYQLKVKDGNNCERTQSVTVNAFGTTLAATISTTNSGCKTSSGQIEVNASGGTGPYSYQLGSAAATSNSTFGNLAAGNYLVKVTDNTGCSTSQNVILTTGIKYSVNVKTIIETKCAVSGCHVSGGSSTNFNNFANVQSSATEIKSRTQSGNMPKNGDKLPQAELDLIACWVDDGAQNN
jgi:hypothetical protein